MKFNKVVRNLGALTLTTLLVHGAVGEDPTVLASSSTQNTRPVFEGDKVITIGLGSDFNPMDGITASDKEDGDITDKVTFDLRYFNPNTTGTSMIIYTVTDSAGAKTSFYRSVQVVNSNEAPELHGIGPVTINKGSDFDPLEGITATDKEDGTITSNIQVNLDYFDVNKSGTQQIIYTITDSKGATDRVTRFVTVVDNTFTLTGVEDIEIGFGKVDSFDLLEGVVVDANYDSNFKITTTGTIAKPSYGTNKTSTITYTVTDSLGTSKSFTRDITVTNQLPVFSGVTDITYTLGEEDDIDFLANITATDYESGDLTPYVSYSKVMNSIDSGYIYYSVCDFDGNVTTKRANINVIVPDEKPVISGESRTTITAGSTFDLMAGMSATDKEDGTITHKLTVDTKSFNPNIAGTYFVIYSVTDSMGQTSTYTRRITVEAANEKPVISGEARTTITTATKFDLLSGITAADTEDGDLTSKITVDAGSFNAKVAGTYYVTYSVTDSKGETTTFTRRIIVETANNAKPVFSGEQRITYKRGTEFDPLNDIVATDAEDGDITDKIQVNLKYFNPDGYGTYMVIYTVTDSAGATTTFYRYVTIVD